MNKPPKITLQAWARLRFDKPYSLPTLRAWARSGKIQPPPVKVGRDWMVEPNAEYCAETDTPPMPAGLSPWAMGILRNG